MSSDSDRKRLQNSQRHAETASKHKIKKMKFDITFVHGIRIETIYTIQRFKIEREKSIHTQ